MKIAAIHRVKRYQAFEPESKILRLSYNTNPSCGCKPDQQMAKSEDHRGVAKSQIGSFGFHPQTPLFLAAVSFFAFPVVLVEFPRIESAGELLVVCLAAAMWMIATLVGIRSIPDIEAAQEGATKTHLGRVCTLQTILLAIGASLFWLCSRLFNN